MILLNPDSNSRKISIALILHKFPPLPGVQNFRIHESFHLLAFQLFPGILPYLFIQISGVNEGKEVRPLPEQLFHNLNILHKIYFITKSGHIGILLYKRPVGVIHSTEHNRHFFYQRMPALQ